ncbi:MAG: hypothetical protein A2W08_03460 [Candidatus Rokubacteria bacterium RBG_16_73_20]|nr:MAG: hypothetical protein A2050_12735 [Candidatus Rokubacteria bacterium GWA2_73_35]OGK96850.1 MAG: hypothetical protein A2W08_03460 [Candidatus Rokubacteria bacterium RBG_16_73_20]HBH03077.1 hypothetical protein [Candidatus Rokubacteria bacterium]
MPPDFIRIGQGFGNAMTMRRDKLRMPRRDVVLALFRPLDLRAEIRTRQVHQMRPIARSALLVPCPPSPALIGAAPIFDFAVFR